MSPAIIASVHMVKNKKAGKGFTLIEILVVASAIILFFGISLRYFNDFNELKKLEVETENLAETLRQARKSAASGDKSQFATETCILTGYSVIYSSENNKYSQHAICNGDKLIGEAALPSEIQLCQSGTITFKQFGLGAISGSIKLRSARINKCREIVIDSSGDINISELIQNCSC